MGIALEEAELMGEEMPGLALAKSHFTTPLMKKEKIAAPKVCISLGEIKNLSHVDGTDCSV